MQFYAFNDSLSLLFITSFLARLRPSPNFVVFFHSRPIFCIRTMALTMETAVLSFSVGVRALLRSLALTPISEIMRRSASLLHTEKISQYIYFREELQPDNIPSYPNTFPEFHQALTPRQVTTELLLPLESRAEPEDFLA